jgi:hypothetical protein
MPRLRHQVAAQPADRWFRHRQAYADTIPQLVEAQSGPSTGAQPLQMTRRSPKQFHSAHEKGLVRPYCQVRALMVLCAAGDLNLEPAD